MREWKNGKIIVCDTSFIHETQNNSERPRYVLIMRHWHPEVTALEKIANEFLFDALDDGTSSGLITAQQVAEKKLNELRKAAMNISAAQGGFGGLAASSSTQKKVGRRGSGQKTKKKRRS